MVRKFFCPEFVETLVNASNDYVEERKKKFPELKQWKQKKVSGPFTMSCMYQMIAIMYYFGIVELPCKYDYWMTGRYCPSHPIVHELGLSCDRFKFLWKIFINLLLAPSYILDQPSESVQESDYLEAQRTGHFLQDCSRYERSCPMSLFEVRIFNFTKVSFFLQCSE